MRQRVYRRKLQTDKDQDGTIYVYLTESNTQDNSEHNTVVNDYIKSLKSEIEAWKEIVKTRDEELKRKDHLLAAALERIPAIEAPKEEPAEPRESPVSDSEDTSKGDVPHDSTEGEIKQSWWRRWFGG